MGKVKPAWCRGEDKRDYGVEVLCCGEGVEEPGVGDGDVEAVVTVFFVAAEAGGESVIVDWVGFCEGGI